MEVKDERKIESKRTVSIDDIAQGETFWGKLSKTDVSRTLWLRTSDGLVDLVHNVYVYGISETYIYDLEKVRARIILG